LAWDMGAWKEGEKITPIRETGKKLSHPRGKTRAGGRTLSYLQGPDRPGDDRGKEKKKKKKNKQRRFEGGGDTTGGDRGTEGQKLSVGGEKNNPSKTQKKKEQDEPWTSAPW